MRFGEPFALLLLALSPLWLLVFSRLERRRARRVAGAGDAPLVNALILADADGGRRRRWAQALLIAASLAFAAVALSRPQLGMRTELRKGRGIDLVIALDLSKSMLARDVVPSRLDRARIEITELVDRLKGDRIGLVGFTSVALPLCPLTVDHSALLLQLRSSSPDDLPRGGTAIGDAITAGERMLASSKKTSAERAILILTDGEDNEGDAVAAAKKAKEAGITVHVVGVGSKTGEPIPALDESGKLTGYMKDRAGQTVVSRLNDTLLREVADAAGGIATLPSEAGGLDLGPIRTHLATLKKAELEERTVRVYEERYQWLLLPSFLGLLLATLLRPTRRPARIVVKNLSKLATLLLLTFGPGAARASSPLEREDPDAQAGNAAIAAGKHAEASEAYGRALERLGDDPRLLFDRGLAAAQGGELDKAASDLRAAMEAGKDPALRAQAAYALGNTYRKLKKWNEAMDAYRRTLLEDPTHTGARRNLEITSRMKAIEAMQPRDPNSKQNEGDKPPPPDGKDGGPNDAGDSDGGPSDGGPSDGSSSDSGGDSRDAGTGSDGSGGQDESRGDSGPKEDASGAQGANQDAGGAADAGSAEPKKAEEEKPTPAEQAEASPAQKDLEEMLDALQRSGKGPEAAAAPEKNGLQTRGEGLVMRSNSADPSPCRSGVAAWLALAACLAFAPRAEASDALQVTASLSETNVVVGDVMTLEISVISHVDGSIEIAIPKFEGLEEVSRSKSESTSIQWGGGGQVITKEYTVTLELEAQKNGKFTIPPVRAQAGNESAESRPLTVNIGAGEEPTPAMSVAPGQVAPPGPGEERLFVRYRIDRTTAYVGEQFLLDLEVYALPSLNLTIDEAAPPPSLDGFWKEVLDQPQRLTRRVESVSGRSYHVYRVWRVALFPLEAGARTIPAAQLTFTLNRSIFGGGQRDRRRAPAIEVEVLPLPTAGRPASFSSQNVGEYRFSAAVDRERVPAGKALVLTLRLNGRGNIKNARLPELPELPGFRSFAPTIQDQVEVTGEGFGGEKKADYLLMPERGGRLEIPPIELVVFNPVAKKYERLSTPSIRVAVEGEPSADALAAAPPGVTVPPTSEASPPAKEQLRPLRFRSTLETPRPPPWKSPMFPSLLVGPPLLFALYVSAEKLRARAAQRHSGRAQERAAAESSRRHLAAAKDAVKAGDAARAFREAQEALVLITTERSGVPLRGLTIDEARAALLARGAPSEWVEALAKELELADHARFGTITFDKSALATAPARWAALVNTIEDWQPQAEVEA